MCNSTSGSDGGFTTDQSVNTTSNVSFNRITIAEYLKTGGELRGKDSFSVLNFTLSGGAWNYGGDFYDGDGDYLQYTYNGAIYYYGGASGYQLIMGEDDPFLGYYYTDWSLNPDYYYLFGEFGPGSGPSYRILPADFLAGIDNWEDSSEYHAGDPAPSCTYTMEDTSPFIIDGNTGTAIFRGLVTMLGGFSANSWVEDTYGLYINPASADIPDGNMRGILYDGRVSTSLFGGIFNSSGTLPTNSIAWGSRVDWNPFASNSIAIGGGKINGAYCGAIGYDTTCAISGFATGYGSYQNFVYTTVHSSHDFSKAGDSQLEKMTLNANTTTATAREMAIGFTINQNPSGTGGGNRLIIPANSMWTYRLSLVGIDVNNVSNIGAFDRLVRATNKAGTVTILSTDTIGTDVNPDSWGGLSVTSVDVTGVDIIQFKVSGKASRSIRWTGNLETTELTLK